MVFEHLKCFYQLQITIQRELIKHKESGGITARDAMCLLAGWYFSFLTEVCHDLQKFVNKRFGQWQSLRHLVGITNQLVLLQYL